MYSTTSDQTQGPRSPSCSPLPLHDCHYTLVVHHDEAFSLIQYVQPDAYRRTLITRPRRVAQCKPDASLTQASLKHQTQPRGAGAGYLRLTRMSSALRMPTPMQVLSPAAAYTRRVELTSSLGWPAAILVTFEACKLIAYVYRDTYVNCITYRYLIHLFRPS
jgi:hypothetical protein